VSSPRFEHAVGFVLRASIEGGYSNNPRDRGGPTNRGISLRAVRQLDADKRLPAFLRAELDIDADGDIDGDDVPGWTRETALKFYRLFYWDAIHGDLLPWPLALIVFDAAVNQGVDSAVRQLQQLCRIPEDGIVGSVTIAEAARLAGADDAQHEWAARRLIVARLARYRTLADADVFFDGWAGRMLDLYVEVLKENA